MKILFVYNFAHQDYLADCIYHGLIDNGMEVYETAYPDYMLSSYPNPSTLYGRGFTIFAKLNHQPNFEDCKIIIEKIKSKFYDLIIYGCVYTHEWVPKRQCLDYLDLVKQYYPRNKVHFLDGSDQTKNFSYEYGLNEYGIVWKRELTDLSFGNPISFAIPEKQLINFDPVKKYMFSSKLNKPVFGESSNPTSYTFSDEKLYYEEYASSYYGYTCKKAGWDCMRHYEILANKCIPYFSELGNCPPYIMNNFPKYIIMECNNYSSKNEIHPNYDDVKEYLFEYTKKNLTTKKLVQKII